MNEDFAIENGILTKYRGSGENVIVPGGVTSIGNKAFVGCSGLKSIALPQGVTSIGEGHSTAAALLKASPCRRV